jgi:hypothetical protein
LRRCKSAPRIVLLDRKSASGQRRNTRRPAKGSFREATILHDLYALSKAFGYFIDHNWARENPVRGVEIPSDKDAVRIHVRARAAKLNGSHNEVLDALATFQCSHLRKQYKKAAVFARAVISEKRLGSVS